MNISNAEAKCHINLQSLMVVRMDIRLNGCTDSDGETMYGLDGEEMAHADWEAKKMVMTLPEFAIPFKYEEGAYENAVANQQVCKANLDTCIQSYKNPPEPQAPPMSSIYPRDDVQLGTANTLICLVTGFYPSRLTVKWTRNNKNVTLGTRNSQLRMNLDDYSFTQFFTLKFTPEERDIYTCTVEHSALGMPMTREFEVEAPPEASVGPSVFCGVGLTLGLLGVATGTFFLVKGNQCN
ncbi:RLA class II histocompatibility antigen, DP alpha-1 chain-like [Engraulis encrasicolus]|uniref:RLA class II histocompatibility antigen, DP alpha-1 chain-like n=1 Tax=Engraulis encrasicolus TaxID=184585 RepID=UPI002FCF5C98